MTPTELETEFSIHDIYGIWAYRYSPTFAFPGESHEPWELVYIQSGRVIVETDTYSVSLSAGNIILHKPFEPHKIKADRIACQVILFSFNVDKNEALYDIADKVLCANQLEISYIMTLISNGIEIVAGKNYIKSSLCAPKFAAKHIVKNTLELLLLELKRSALYPPITENAFHNHNATSNTIILTIINYLNNNIYRKITLNDIAKNTAYSVSSISALFKKHTGESIMDYFIKIRIQKACELLMQDNLSIKKVSERLNFSTAQYFSSQFKKIIGMTPLQFRKEMKGKTHPSDISYENV